MQSGRKEFFLVLGWVVRNFQLGKSKGRDKYRPNTHLGDRFVNTSASTLDIAVGRIAPRLTGPENGVSQLYAVSQLTTLTKMSSEQCLFPGFDLRNPLIEHEHGWDPTKHRNPQEEDNQSPGGDAQVGAIESRKIQPCTNIDKAGTVEHEVDHSGERFLLGLLFESAIPSYCATCKIKQGRLGFVAEKTCLTYLQQTLRGGHPFPSYSRLRW